jgi:ornithine carbamoyltransferase
MPPPAISHFLSLTDCTSAELMTLLAAADRLRAAWHAGTLPRLLDGRAVALWFSDTGFRNRVAFEIGIKAMGGLVAHIPGVLGEREAIADMAAYLSNWFAGIVVRCDRHDALLQLAAAATVPVVNARTVYNHPCEVLGDLQFIRAQCGALDGLRVAFIGEASNLCHTWFEAAARLPIRVIQACPDGYHIAPERLASLRHDAVGELDTTCDVEAALSQADVVYTDCWPRATDPPDRERIRQLFSPYRVTRAALQRCAPTVLFLPCPPVHRGEEVDAAVMQSPHCRVYEAKEYLLHAQNAILAWALGTL